MARVTAKEILGVAKKEIGYKESPTGSNRTKYGKWYGLDGQPWCMMFIMWVFDQLEALDLLPVKTASCGALMRAAQSKKLWVTKDLKPGDIVIFDFPGGAKTDHCGLVESVGGTNIVTIEGNTATGNDSNGGEVMRRTRMIREVIGACRPDYEQEDDDVDISKWTDQEILALAERMQSVLGKRSISNTLRSELEEAKNLGITDGSSPNAYCTRAQAAVMVKRGIKR